MFQESSSDTSTILTSAPSVSASTDSSPQFAKVRHLVFGPLVALQDTIKTLHKRGYADANDWSQPQPTDDAGEFVTVLIKKLRIG